MNAAKMWQAMLMILFAFIAAHADIEYSDPENVILNVKHLLGRAKLDLKQEQNQAGIDTIIKTRNVLGRWIKHLEEDAKEKNNDAEMKTKETSRVSTEEFRIERTSVPDKCKRRSVLDGDSLKLHFVAKFLPEKKIFSSSFHTGSLDVKIDLGGRDTVAQIAMTEGLRGVCRGERRNVYMPAAMAFGLKGQGSVPPNSDLLFHFEITDITLASGRKQERQERLKEWDQQQEAVKEEL